MMAGFFEQNGNIELARRGVDQSISADQGGGNLESKEVRFGAASSGIFASSTTGTSTGCRRQRPRQLHAARRHDPARQHEAR